MTSKELIKKLKKDGWYKVGGKGDHEKFKHLTKGSSEQPLKIKMQ